MLSIRHVKAALCALLLATSQSTVHAEMSEPNAGNSVGSQAPDFSLSGSDGQTHKLSDYRGKQPVVIAFFPKAFTGG